LSRSCATLSRGHVRPARCVCDRQALNTNQFSVTEHFRPIQQREGQGLPGMFVFYELSPIMVKFTESRESFLHFITQLYAQPVLFVNASLSRYSCKLRCCAVPRFRAHSLSVCSCAILGGVFTVAGLVDRVVFSSLRHIEKKMNMGKLG
jgi:hypothetical protein